MMEVIIPGLGRACDYWAARSLERRPSDGRRHSCLPSASSCFESPKRERNRMVASLKTILTLRAKEGIETS